MSTEHLSSQLPASSALSIDHYERVLGELKAAVRSARLSAMRQVNTELIGLYWKIGCVIVERRDNDGWGAKVTDRLSTDLQREFPSMTGLSPRNLRYMQAFAGAWRRPIGQQAVAQLPWGHLTVLLDRLNDQPSRDWYADQAVANGWSRAVLMHQIKSNLLGRMGAAPNNFPAALDDSDLADQLIKDPYNFDFLGFTKRVDERALEQRLIDRVQEFLLELGEGFALYARQRQIKVGSKEFVVDLIFFHVVHQRFVIVELKVDEFDPAHVGQLQFYVEWAERHLRGAEHQPTVGILLVDDKDDVVVRYALAAASARCLVVHIRRPTETDAERTAINARSRRRGQTPELVDRLDFRSPRTGLAHHHGHCPARSERTSAQRAGRAPDRWWDGPRRDPIAAESDRRRPRRREPSCDPPASVRLDMRAKGLHAAHSARGVVRRHRSY
jgi:predicted nuclease of restriction endonuclease-like (RecB) superfamily